MFDPKKPYDLKLLHENLEYDKAANVDIIASTRDILGELRGACRAMPDTLLLTYPTLLKEAVDSSKIENIETTIEDAFENAMLPEEQRSSADKLVIKYREAAYRGFEKVKELGVSTRVIVELHQILIPESAGGYRRLQNHIKNKSTGEIVYTPPTANNINDYLNNWENFVNSKTNKIDPLVKAAFAHFQFEAIHPFEDGNGRVGRMLMVLQLINDGVLSHPVLHISTYINKHKSEYYQALAKVTHENKFSDFLNFMLMAFNTQASETLKLVNMIIDLYQDYKTKIRVHEKTSSLHNIDQVTEMIFKYPKINPSTLSEELAISADTASANLRKLSEAGFLTLERKGKYAFYTNDELLKYLS